MRSQERIRELPALLNDAYGIQAPVSYYDHHYCHATSAYYTSGFERALVNNLDGGVDGRSGSVYVGENCRMRELAGLDRFNSMVNFYSYVTENCLLSAEK
jgi:carbamoyltransferase